MCLYHSKTLLAKTRNFSVWSLARFGREEGYTKHRKLWICEVNLTLEICSLVNCLSPVKETFHTVKLSWMGGKGEVKQANSKLAELWAGQWYMCLAELKEVNFGGLAKSVIVVGELFSSFGELLSSLELTNSKFSTSELLITSESVEHQWIFESSDHHTKIWNFWPG